MRARLRRRLPLALATLPILVIAAIVLRVTVEAPRPETSLQSLLLAEPLKSLRFAFPDTMTVGKPSVISLMVTDRERLISDVNSWLADQGVVEDASDIMVRVQLRASDLVFLAGNTVYSPSSREYETAVQTTLGDLSDVTYWQARPTRSGPIRVDFVLYLAAKSSGVQFRPHSVSTVVQTNLDPLYLSTDFLAEYWLPALIIAALPFLGWLVKFSSDKARREEARRDLAQIAVRVENEPEKVRPVWESAQVRLELYADGNISQLNAIFWFSVWVMFVGFVLIFFGMWQALNPGQIQKSIDVASGAGEQGRTAFTLTPAIVGMAAGIITEFIGATFLLIYRTTVQQAEVYFRSLDRINSVGMALSILDAMSSTAQELNDRTKADIARMVIGRAETYSTVVESLDGQDRSATRAEPPVAGM